MEMSTRRHNAPRPEGICGEAVGAVEIQKSLCRRGCPANKLRSALELTCEKSPPSRRKILHPRVRGFPEHPAFFIKQGAPLCLYRVHTTGGAQMVYFDISGYPDLVRSDPRTAPPKIRIRTSDGGVFYFGSRYMRI